jgi:serine/threonine protein kinase
MPVHDLHILELHAQGGMAEVFRATGTDEDGNRRTYAVKKVIAQYARDDAVLQMFIEEARVAACLHHPHIVGVHDLVRSPEGELFIVMDFIDGRDLADVAHAASMRGQKLPPSFAVHVALQVLDALDYAYNATDPSGARLGLVHRDISPHNVLLTRTGDILLADFGIAKVETNNAKTMMGIIKGKFGYMSPEQARARPLDGRSDLFNVGILLFELCTGERLFAGESELHTLELMRGAVVPRMAPSLGVPAGLEAFTRACLAREPDKRPVSASVAKAQLHDLATQAKCVGSSAQAAQVLQRLLPSKPAYASSTSLPAGDVLKSQLFVAGAPALSKAVAPGARKGGAARPVDLSSVAPPEASTPVARGGAVPLGSPAPSSAPALTPEPASALAAAPSPATSTAKANAPASPPPPPAFVGVRPAPLPLRPTPASTPAPTPPPATPDAHAPTPAVRRPVPANLLRKAPVAKEGLSPPSPQPIPSSSSSSPSPSPSSSPAPSSSPPPPPALLKSGGPPPPPAFLAAAATATAPAPPPAPAPNIATNVKPPSGESMDEPHPPSSTASAPPAPAAAHVAQPVTIKRTSRSTLWWQDMRAAWWQRSVAVSLVVGVVVGGVVSGAWTKASAASASVHSGRWIDSWPQGATATIGSERVGTTPLWTSVVGSEVKLEKDGEQWRAPAAGVSIVVALAPSSQTGNRGPSVRVRAPIDVSVMVGVGTPAQSGLKLPAAVSLPTTLRATTHNASTDLALELRMLGTEVAMLPDHKGPGTFPVEVEVWPKGGYTLDGVAAAGVHHVRKGRHELSWGGQKPVILDVTGPVQWLLEDVSSAR